MGSLFEVVLILVLVVANGVFAMSQTAIVASRRARLQQRAEGGDAKARRALALAEDPNVFLATVQIGITLIGILAGAFGGATIADRLEDVLAGVPVLGPYAGTIAIALVVLVITYLSLVVGELVPKRIALNNPEGISSVVAGPMSKLSFITSPFVSLLGVSTDALLKLLRVRTTEEPPVTEEEIGVLLDQGAQAGVFDEAEREIVGRVFEIADLDVAAMMTPRPDVVWLDLNAPPERRRATVLENPHSRFPVCRGELDDVVGVVHARDLLARSLGGEDVLDLASSVRQPLLVPEGTPALRLLEEFRRSGEHVALVVDEYGGAAGLATHHDVLEEIVGDIPPGGTAVNERAVRREDGSWLLDGTLRVHELEDLLGAGAPIPERGYETLAGFVLDRLGHIPGTGETFEWGGWRFEVADMDGNRIDKVLATPPAEGELSGGDTYRAG